MKMKAQPTFWRRLRAAWLAAAAAWKQYPLAIQAAHDSYDSGNGWNSCCYPEGFVDLYEIGFTDTYPELRER